MLAVHEHEARPFLSALDDHDTQGPTLAHDDDVLRVLTLDERSWEEPDTAGAPLEEAPTSERGLNAADPETDQGLARYFGEVRRRPRAWDIREAEHRVGTKEKAAAFPPSVETGPLKHLGERANID